MVTVPGPCPAGGLHEMTPATSHTVLFLAAAPGQSGWRACSKCGALVIDEFRPGPEGEPTWPFRPPTVTILHQ